MKKILILFLILLFGCSGKFNYIVKENPVQPKILDDKALIYVIRPSYIGFLVPFNVYFDDKLIGLTKGETYFYFYANPGKHTLKTKAKNMNELELDLSAGKRYFIKQNIIIDKITPGTKTFLISEKEGEESIKKIKMLEFITIPR